MNGRLNFSAMCLALEVFPHPAGPQTTMMCRVRVICVGVVNVPDSVEQGTGTDCSVDMVRLESCLKINSKELSWC